MDEGKRGGGFVGAGESCTSYNDVNGAGERPHPYNERIFGLFFVPEQNVGLSFK
jgi:hypothetical protein